MNVFNVNQIVPVLKVVPSESLRILRSNVRNHHGIAIECNRRFLASLKKQKCTDVLPSQRHLKKVKTEILLFKSKHVGHVDNIVVRVPPVLIDNFLENDTTDDDVKSRKYKVGRNESIPVFCAVNLKSFSKVYLQSTLKNNYAHFNNRGIQVRLFRTEKEPRMPRFVNLKNKHFPSSQDKDNILKELITQDQKTMALLNDPSASKEEKDNIKLAFAEGYINGTASHTSKKNMSVLKIVQKLLSVISIGVLILIIATSSVLKLTSQVAINPETIKVTFEDVKGADEAKNELEEVVEFLRNPDRFSRVGGKLPKGVLLVGPPGTGKTLLARALAGEAGVPFFHTCGAEFDEMLVGQGARRVRDLFKTAKERAPCVIFIDEIDAVGCKRTNSILHPHANQTVNQLLAEMDGFNPNEGVIVLGATNRRDDLDPALLRPGRFDLEVMVANPDYKGRMDILTLYLNKIRCRDVDVELLARGTIGFTGADLENMVNQAAIRAGADGADYVTMEYLEAARDKALMGPEIRSRVRDEESNLITAYHEAGHALVAHFTKDAQPLHKVTIVARGSSLGHTSYIPEKDRYHITKSELLARMDTMMGGRAAEDLIFGPEKVTSGAAGDLKSATNIASQMVKDWGMSERAGLRSYSNRSEPDKSSVGQTTQDIIDREIQTFLEESYERAKRILQTHAKEHRLLAETLLKCETLDAEQVKKLLTEMN